MAVTGASGGRGGPYLARPAHSRCSVTLDKRIDNGLDSVTGHLCYEARGCESKETGLQENREGRPGESWGPEGWREWRIQAAERIVE